jgi:hypothetical protein
MPVAFGLMAKKAAPGGIPQEVIDALNFALTSNIWSRSFA